MAEGKKPNLLEGLSWPPPEGELAESHRLTQPQRTGGWWQSGTDVWPVQTCPCLSGPVREALAGIRRAITASAAQASTTDPRVMMYLRGAEQDLLAALRVLER